VCERGNVRVRERERQDSVPSLSHVSSWSRVFLVTCLSWSIRVAEPSAPGSGPSGRACEVKQGSQTVKQRSNDGDSRGVPLIGVLGPLRV
jgi:hypothetical protein